MLTLQSAPTPPVQPPTHTLPGPLWDPLLQTLYLHEWPISFLTTILSSFFGVKAPLGLARLVH